MEQNHKIRYANENFENVHTWKAFYLLLAVLAYSLTMKMETIYSSKILMNSYCTTWHYNQEIVLFIVIAKKTVSPKCFSAVLFHLHYECSKLKIQSSWKNGCPSGKMPVNVLTAAN
jgi:hypothetical protein